MLLLTVVLVTISVAISAWRIMVRGGKGNFAPPSLRLIVLPVFALVLQFVALQSPNGLQRFVLLALFQGMLLVFFAANWHHSSLRLLAMGVLLNLIPIVFNGGYMPITPQAMIGLHPETVEAQWTTGFTHAGSKDIVLPATQAAFWFLGDVFVLRRPFPMPTAFSLGDVAIVVGYGWTVYQFALPRRVRHEQNRSGSSRLRGGGR